MSEAAVSDDRRWSVGVDFDGVIHQYVTPWIAPDVIPDPPVEGALAWLEEMSEHFNVVIQTTRARPQAVEGREGLVDGRDAIRVWLREHGMRSSVQHRLVVTHEKLPCLIYIDDRGWRFTGANFPTRQEIHQARPWNKLRAPVLVEADPVHGPHLRCPIPDCGFVWELRADSAARGKREVEEGTAVWQSHMRADHA